MEIEIRLEAIRNRMRAACERSKRRFEDVTLVAVSKTRSAEEIDQARKAGVTDVGENRVQEADEKRAALGDGPLRWHLVGHLQKNKVRKAVELFDVIHSLDSVSLGRRIDRVAGELGARQSTLVQVDLAEESTKFGLPGRDLFPALEELGELPSLSVEGLMILPPYLEEAEEVRPYFRRLRELGEEARERGLLENLELSMGMSHDFDVAIEEGATMIRVGTALFGPRESEVRAVSANQA